MPFASRLRRARFRALALGRLVPRASWGLVAGYVLASALIWALPGPLELAHRHQRWSPWWGGLEVLAAVGLTAGLIIVLRRLVARLPTTPVVASLTNQALESADAKWSDTERRRRAARDRAVLLEAAAEAPASIKERTAAAPDASRRRRM